MKGVALAGIVVASLVGAVGLSNLHPYGNQRVKPVKGLGTLLQSSDLPVDARAVLIAKCADCHSNETRWPLYARVAPGSWLIEKDIAEGRKHMNLSLWSELSTDQQGVLKAEIAHQAKVGTMPPVQYRLVHWGATLSTADVKLLAALRQGEVGAEASAGGVGNAERGKAVFDKRCTGCHAMDVDREGPRLGGVFGRKAASVAGFAYSAGLKNSGLTWTDANLDKWLTDPDAMFSDNNMSISVPKAEERRDLIAYFKMQSAH